MREPDPATQPVYGDILRLDSLLDLQAELAGVRDDLFFVVMHQSHELWFKVLLHELEAAREHIACGDVAGAVDRLHRARDVERLLASHLDALGTLSLESFDVLRDRLGTSSGFQSAQFREIEFLSGSKDLRYLNCSYFSAAERERLVRRYREPSLPDAFRHLLDNRAIVDLNAAIRDGDTELADLVAALLGHDRGFHEWRARHIEAVQRFIGGKPGTGGTSGLSYLNATLERRFFPDLWHLRTTMAYPPELSRLTATTGATFDVVPYGQGDEQFGELWPSSADGPVPVVVLLHGGYWRSEYRLDVMHAYSAALQAMGLAVWNLEFRRVGSPGGGWPGTFEDVAAGFDALTGLSDRYAIDLGRVAVLGHSAGGHLALWVAARGRLAGGTGSGPRLVPALAVSLAGIGDLVEAARRGLSNGAVPDLLGGGPATHAGVYRNASPSMSLPLGVAQLVVHGTEDTSVPYDLSTAFAAAAAASGDDCEFLGMPGVDHFSLIDPGTGACRAVLDRLRARLCGQSRMVAGGAG